jgi:superfamily I DNA/RNA helicase
LREWGGAGPAWDALAVAALSHELVTAVVRPLEDADIPTVEMTANGPKGGDGVHVGTMHRFKGLEFQRLIVTGVSAGLVPRRGIERWRDTDPIRYGRERQRDRSLLFVAATRARDELAIFWHGVPSPFLSEAT